MARRRIRPNYLEPSEVEALLANAPHDSARMLILLQWRAGLRVSEALSLRVEDLDLKSDRPTFTVHRPLSLDDRRFRRNKDGKHRWGHPRMDEARLLNRPSYYRVVPVHPELAKALRSWKGARDGRVLRARRSTADRWMRSAVDKARRHRKLAKYGRRLSSRTLRNGYIVHMLIHGIPLDTLREWLGLATYHPMSQYLALLPNPEAILDRSRSDHEDVLATIP